MKQMTSAICHVTINLSKLWFTSHKFFWVKIREKILYSPFFLFFLTFIYDSIVYAYFTYTTTASTITEDVPKLVMRRVYQRIVLWYFFHAHF